MRQAELTNRQMESRKGKKSGPSRSAGMVYRSALGIPGKAIFGPVSVKKNRQNKYRKAAMGPVKGEAVKADLIAAMVQAKSSIKAAEIPADASVVAGQLTLKPSAQEPIRIRNNVGELAVGQIVQVDEIAQQIVDNYMANRVRVYPRKMRRRKGRRGFTAASFVINNEVVKQAFDLDVKGIVSSVDQEAGTFDFTFVVRDETPFKRTLTFAISDLEGRTDKLSVGDTVQYRKRYGVKDNASAETELKTVGSDGDTEKFVSLISAYDTFEQLPDYEDDFSWPND